MGPSPRRHKCRWALVEGLEPRVFLSTYTVTNLNDSGPGSLRDAVQQSNADSGPDTINFAAGLTGTITLTSGQLQISDPIGTTTIVGPDGRVLSISGNDASRVFQIDAAATADLSGLGIIYGIVSANDPTGGGILNSGSLLITNCNLNDDHALNPGSNLASGGAIYNNGTLSINGCTFSADSAYAGNGGGIFNSGTLHVTGSQFSGDAAVRGGGIYNAGNSGITDCDFSSNWSVNEFNGGGIYNAAGTLSAKSTSFTGNSAGDGAGIYNGNAALTVTGCTFSGNGGPAGTGANYGAGIFNSGTLLVSSTDFAGNTANFGGGIAEQGGTAAVTGCAFSQDSVLDSGGGIDDSGGSMLVEASLFDNDSGSAQSSGGAIHSAVFTAKVTVINSTFTADHAGNGGAIAETGKITVINSTICACWASAGGGIYVGTGSSAALQNTIVAGNTLGDRTTPSDINGTISGSYNLIGTADGLTGPTAGFDGNQIGTAANPIDPKLRPLGDYGGPTQTMPPLPGSPAIDAGSNALAVGPDGKPLPTDQRGYYRIFNHTVDIGAVEYGSLPLLPGDANADGKVGFADLVLVARNYGMISATWADGDFNSDRSVGFDDLVIVARNYGKSVSLSSATAINAAPITSTIDVPAADELPRLARASRHRH